SRRRVFVFFRSFTMIRRYGARVELRLAFTPRWLAPPVEIDLGCCTIVDTGIYLTVREHRSGVLIRTMGRSRRLFEAALTSARSPAGASYDDTGLHELARGNRDVAEWIADADGSVQSPRRRRSSRSRRSRSQ